MKKRQWLFIPVVTIIITFLILVGCTPAGTAITPSVAEPVQQPTTAVNTQSAQPATPPATLIGGKLIIGSTEEIQTLDPLKSSWSDLTMGLIGGSLIYIDDKGNYVPYLAESWTVTPDGLVWDFKLREDVKFHNGEPLTAKEYAWTYQTALDPKTASPAAGPALGDVKSIEAPDDYTLRITLNAPNFPLLYGLAEPGFMQPVPPDVYQKEGDKFGHNPVGVGPYKFKEWVAGDHITLERNPDFAWPPAPWKGDKIVNYFDTIEFRFIPEYSTVLSGLESGDIDYAAIQPKDVELVKGLDRFQLFNTLTQGTYPAIWINVTKPPFDDLNVRRAFNYAIDRESIVKIVALGYGEVQKGPISSSVVGYWKGIEELGYDFNLDKAKELMTAAGYVYGSDGMLSKDGKPFQLTLYSQSTNEEWTKIAEILKEQYKELGVDITIVLEDPGVNQDRLVKGDYEASIASQEWGEADTMYYMFHSSMIGGFNWSMINDPALDKLLDLTRNETDAVRRQQAVDDTAKMVVDQALIVPIYAPMRFYALSNRIEGATFSKFTYLNIWTAYVKK